jgi:hypothetical protein
MELECALGLVWDGDGEVVVPQVRGIRWRWDGIIGEFGRRARAVLPALFCLSIGVPGTGKVRVLWIGGFDLIFFLKDDLIQFEFSPRLIEAASTHAISNLILIALILHVYTPWWQTEAENSKLALGVQTRKLRHWVHVPCVCIEPSLLARKTHLKKHTYAGSQDRGTTGKNKPNKNASC